MLYFNILQKKRIISIFLGLYLMGSLFFLTSCAAFVGVTGAGVMLAPDRRTTGTIIDDQTLHIRTQLALNRDTQVRENSHIASAMYNKTLLLTGQVANEKIRSRAFSLATKISQIEKIYNEIDIAEPSSYRQRIRDTWITAQVKLKLLLNREIGAGRILVLTENGIVYLLGMLNTEEEHTASNIARQVSGVQKVVKLFESVASVETAPLG